MVSIADIVSVITLFITAFQLGYAIGKHNAKK